MPLKAGDRLGPYQIVSLVGAGGMGEVYRARDTRLERTVAIKILSTAIDTPSAREQFDREARVISSLTGPNICTLYDVGTQDDRAFLVMEYLEGETLSHRLAAGPLPIRKALDYAMQIAQALDQIHRQGLIHRDLKPSNIMLTKSGVKLLDFGLAKIARNPEWLFGPSDTTHTLTSAGPLLGTCQYVAPELFAGRKPDTRCDIFAFGAVLYEMITGRRAFEGATQAITIANILEHEPPPMAPGESSPPNLSALDHLVRTCLLKDPEERRQTAHDILLELRWLADLESPPKAAEQAAALRLRPAWVVSALVVFAAVLVSAFLLLRHSTKAQIQRLSFLPPEGASFVANSLPAMSPNGRRVVFAALREGKTRLWVRDLDSPAPWAVPGTEGGYDPFWAPASDEVAFFAAGKLRKVKLTGEPPSVVCDAMQGRGGSWNRNGIIIFTPSTTEPIYRVSAQGGKPEAVTSFDTSLGETSHRWPWFLPDGRHFLFSGRSQEPSKTALYVGDLETKQRVRIQATGSNAVYSPPGFLLYVSQHSLMAEAFDPGRLRSTGDPFRIADGVELISANLQASFSASESGAVAYYSGQGNLLNSQLGWFDRSGKQTGSLGEPGTFVKPAISPDGRTLAVDRLDSQTGSYDIWLYELPRGNATRLTFDARQDGWPVWSPDGASIAFASNRAGHYQIYRKSAFTTSKEEVLVESLFDKFPSDWSRDGRYLIYYEVDPVTKYDIWAVPLTGDHKPIPLLTSPFNEHRPSLSPDSRWLAYASDETGLDEIYVQSFPSMGRKTRISVDGGTRPVWSRDGKELFYIAADRRLMVAPVKGGEKFEAGAPHALFVVRQNLTRFFDVSPDGRHFLLIDPLPDPAPPAIGLVLNWNAGK